MLDHRTLHSLHLLYTMGTPHSTATLHISPRSPSISHRTKLRDPHLAPHTHCPTLRITRHPLCSLTVRITLIAPQQTTHFLHHTLHTIYTPPANTMPNLAHGIMHRRSCCMLNVSMTFACNAAVDRAHCVSWARLGPSFACSIVHAGRVAHAWFCSLCRACRLAKSCSPAVLTKAVSSSKSILQAQLSNMQCECRP